MDQLSNSKQMPQLPRKTVKNINLSDCLSKINRKRKMKALMRGNPKEIAKHLNAEKRMKERACAANNKEENKVSEYRLNFRKLL